MSIREPQYDLRIGTLGGSDIWDSGLAGSLLTLDFFEAVVSGITVDLGSSILRIESQDTQNYSQAGITTSLLSFSCQQLSQSQLFGLTSSILKWAARSVDQGGAGGISLNAATFLLASLAESLSGGSEINSVTFNLLSQTVEQSYAVPPPELVAANFKFDSSNTTFPVAIDQNNTLDNLIYLKLRVLGYRGQLNDMLYDFFVSSGKELNDRERLWLVNRTGDSEGTVDDLWEKYLNSLGYSGALLDMKRDFWINY